MRNEQIKGLYSTLVVYYINLNTSSWINIKPLNNVINNVSLQELHSSFSYIVYDITYQILL